MNLWPFKKGSAGGPVQRRPGVPVDRVVALSSQGLSEPEIIDSLKNDGYSPLQVDMAMKEAVKRTMHNYSKPSRSSPMGEPGPQPLPQRKPADDFGPMDDPGPSRDNPIYDDTEDDSFSRQSTQRPMPDQRRKRPPVDAPFGLGGDDYDMPEPPHLDAEPVDRESFKKRERLPPMGDEQMPARRQGMPQPPPVNEYGFVKSREMDDDDMSDMDDDSDVEETDASPFAQRRENRPVPHIVRKDMKHEYTKVERRRAIEELAESVVDEKWQQFKSRMDSVDSRLEKIEQKISDIEKKVSNFENQKSERVDQLEDKVEHYNTSMTDIGSKMMSMEKTLKDTLTPMMQTMRSLSDAVGNVKSAARPAQGRPVSRKQEDDKTEFKNGSYDPDEY